ncbi:MAG: translocation protein TolB [bacterium ADurb.Bin157]|jgi:WD40 repeat protein|nr:hypothetical protein [Candidatus Riflebacteria bacterium]MDD3376377.1 hypothetical protein [Candidatus Riflebacteria bacterium]NCB45562.1 hypothetical protein [bacterium]NLV93826.1 hypothetical protein [Candidatus Riflebacteria bacterium]OQB46130.1 MAG: translocation protein TolB [bacterium ADurb.Bin157]
MQKRLLTVLMTALIIFSGFAANAQEKPKGKIYFIDAPSADKSFLASINADGTNKERLTPAFNNLSFPIYNEKSGWIGFTNKTPSLESEIYLMTRKRVKRVLIGATLEDFSPDGKSLLYSTTDGKGELYIYNIARKRSVQISQNLKVISAKWSPDSEWIIASAFTDDGTTDLYLISTLAQGIKRLTDTKKVNESFPIFCNDSKTILYTTDRYGDYEMEYMAVETPDIYRPAIHGLFPTLSPDNEFMAYESASRVMIASKTGLNPTFLTEGKTPFWVKK